MAKNLKLEVFRSLFKEFKIKAYVLPSTDAHQSEYLAERDFRVKFLSGFSGSNAFTVITEDKALLWTDGRYFIQAVNEFEPGWELMKQGISEAVEPSEWLTMNLKSGDAVGFDPALFSISQGITFVKQLKDSDLVPTPLKENLVDKIWDNRPEEIIKKITMLSIEECGKNSIEKIEDVKEKFLKKKCDSYLLTCLDDIAWLLNIRGFDIPYNPLVFSVIFITMDSINFFVDKRKLNDSDFSTLEHVTIHDYDETEKFIKSYHEKHKNSKNHKVYVPDSTNYFLGTLISEENRIVGISHIQGMKAIKNTVEMEGMRECHIRDSAAVVRFLLWLKNEINLEKKITELIAAKKIDSYRKDIEKFVSLSFTTISAVDHHAALPHYHPNELDGNTEIRKNSVYLVDSGGQYRDGTTDVTRTVNFSDEIDPYFSKMFTLVLKGHIDNANANFPDGINGSRLDILARKFLWDEGYDFGHGVGHGVGHFLNVHEGPIGIGYRSVRPDGGLHKGQVITIEPGYYETNKFGIRIENCYEIVSSGPLESEANNFLSFEALTWVPIQRELIQKSLLDQKHIDWINSYHEKCLLKVGPYLKKRGWNEEYEFLENQCRKI